MCATCPCFPPLQRHGVLPWAQLLQPVIQLAAEGFPAHPYLVATLRWAGHMPLCGLPLARAALPACLLYSAGSLAPCAIASFHAAL